MNDSITSRIPVEPGKGCQHLMCRLNYKSRIDNGVDPVGTLFRCDVWLKAERKAVKRNRKRQVRQELDLDRLNELKSQIDDGREPTESDAPPDGLDTYTASFDFDLLDNGLPAVLVRSDGETLLYAGKLNSVFGIPGCGKSWVAAIAIETAVARGGHVLYWDFEDSPQTFFQRAVKLGFDPRDHAESFRYVRPAMSESETAMSEAQAFLSSAGPDSVQSLVVIDSAEASGCPSDGRDVNEWLDSHVKPWRDVGAGVLLIDHVPKRADESGHRPRGGIGSQRKLAAIDGVALAVSGVPWTKKTNGRLTLTNHKDRGGDLPAPAGKIVATITGNHHDGMIRYTIDAPDAKDETDDNTDQLPFDVLITISEAGPDGVTGAAVLREIVGGKATATDRAVRGLEADGLVAVSMVGSSKKFTLTDSGIALVKTMEEN